MLKSKWTILVLLQVIVSLLAGIFLSKMSLIGRIGVSTLYTEYSFFKILAQRICVYINCATTAHCDFMGSQTIYNL